MESEGPRIHRLLLTTLLFLVIAGGAWYIAYLRARNASLQTQPAATTGVPAPSGTPFAEPDIAPLSAVQPRSSLTPRQREAMLRKLRAESSPDRQVWFAIVPNNAHSAALQRTLQAIFEEAGWRIRGNTVVPFGMKPGIFVFSAEENPPAYVGTAHGAIDAAGLTVVYGRGYRQFYTEKKKENPNWNGFAMEPDQAYVVVIGPQPPP